MAEDLSSTGSRFACLLFGTLSCVSSNGLLDEVGTVCCLDVIGEKDVSHFTEASHWEVLRRLDMSSVFRRKGVM